MTIQALCQRRMRESGRCVTCCRPHTSGLARCRGCQDKANAAHRAKRRELIAQGRCQECRAGMLGVSKFTRCLACRIQHAKARKRSQHRAVAA